MAHTLELSNGTTTISFLGSSGDAWCLLNDGGLTINKPSINEGWSGGASVVAGQVLSEVQYKNRTITLEFEIVGNNRNEIIYRQGEIANLLHKARVAQLSPYREPRVYLKYQIDTMTYPVYFDVLSGNIELPENIMSVEALNWRKGSQYTIKNFRVELTCKPLARGTSATVKTATTIQNTHDSSYVNYIDITGSSVLGDVFSPATLYIYSGGVASSRSRMHIWAGVRDANVSDFIDILEAEDGSYSSYSTLTAQDSALSGASGGGYAVEHTTSSSSGLLNGDLEDNDASSDFDNWVEDDGYGTITVEGSIVHGGSYAAKFTEGATASVCRMYQNVYVNQGGTYTLSFYTRGDGTYAGYYQVVTAAGNDIIPKTSTGVTGTSYTLVEEEFTVPSNVNLIRIYFHGCYVNAGVTYYDDITLTGTIDAWEQTIDAWTLSSGLVEKYKGPVRALAVGSFSANCRYRLKYYLGGVSVMLYRAWEWSRIEEGYDYSSDITENTILDLGVVDLVPYDVAYGETVGSRIFYFEVLPDSKDVAYNTRLDAIIFIPADDNKYRMYKSPDASGISTTTTGIEDNGIKDTVRYYSSSGTSYTHSWDQFGFPILLEPGKSARIFFTGTHVVGGSSLRRWLPETDYTVSVVYTPYYYNIEGAS